MIAVVIVDFECETLTRKCIASLCALGRSDLIYVVVDNGGAIEARQFEADFPDCVVIRATANMGFGAGCNIGVSRALQDGAKFCLLLNPDTVATSDFIEPLLAVMGADDTIGVACPTLRDDNQTGEIAFGGSSINWWIGRPYVIRGRRMQTSGPCVDVPFASGAAMMLRAAGVKDVGPMDEGYFLYFEDAEYSQKFIRAGWRVVYAPEPEVRHAASSVAGFQSERYVYYFARNRIRFMRRCANWHHWVVFYFYNALIRMPGALIVFGLVRCKPKLADAYLRGFRDGLLGRSGRAPI